MANFTTGNIWKLDTVGVISTTPVKIKKVIFIPNAAGDSAELGYWFPGTENSTYINSTKSGVTTTVASASQIQSTGNFTTSDVAAGDVITITETSTGNNEVTRLVASRDSDNQVTVTPADLTNESTKVYYWTVFNGYTAISILSQATNKREEEQEFYEGVWFPALTLKSISASGALYVYIM